MQPYLNFNAKRLPCRTEIERHAFELPRKMIDLHSDDDDDEASACKRSCVCLVKGAACYVS